MRPIADIRRAQVLVEAGWPLLRVAQELGLARATIRGWRDEGFDRLIASRQETHPNADLRDHPDRLDVGSPGTHPCVAPSLAEAVPEAYAYLLGQYLGDGTVSRMPKSVYKLRIFCCSHYPGIIGRTVGTARAIVPGKVSTYKVKNVNLVVVTTHWKHLPCLFPQHGPGRKHDRLIILNDWQNEILLAHPQRFLRGLIESDGCRVINRVNGGEYPRYMFSNASKDIMALCIRTIEQLGLHWTTANSRNIAVSRRPDVEYLDSFIGPKW